MLRHHNSIQTGTCHGLASLFFTSWNIPGCMLNQSYISCILGNPMSGHESKSVECVKTDIFLLVLTEFGIKASLCISDKIRKWFCFGM